MSERDKIMREVARKIRESKNIWLAAHNDTIVVATDPNAEDYITRDVKSKRRWLFLMEKPELLATIYKTATILHQLNFSNMYAQKMETVNVINYMSKERCTLAYYLGSNGENVVFGLSELEAIMCNLDMAEDSVVPANVSPRDLNVVSIKEAHEIYERESASGGILHELAKADTVEMLRRQDDGMPAVSRVKDKNVLMCRVGKAQSAESMKRVVAEQTETNVDLWYWVPITVDQLAQIVADTNGIINGAAITFGENVGIYDKEGLLEAAAQRKLWYSDTQEPDFDTANLQRDMRKVCGWLWESEDFNMWDKDELVSLAYTLDRMHQTMSRKEYDERLAEWHSYVQIKVWHVLALSIAATTAQMSGSDKNFVLSENERSLMYARYDEIRKGRETGNATIFGIMPTRCAPGWFNETIGKILEEQRILLRNRFDDATKANGFSQEQSDLFFNSMYKVSKELLLEVDWVLKFGKFKYNNPITTYDHKLGKIMRAEDYYNNIEGNKTIIGAYIAMLLNMSDNLSENEKRDSEGKGSSEKAEAREEREGGCENRVERSDKKEGVEKVESRKEDETNVKEKPQNIHKLSDEVKLSQTTRKSSDTSIKSQNEKADENINEKNDNASEAPQPNRIVYRGESEQDLTNRLLRCGGVNWMNLNKESDNPKGIIFVGKDMMGKWIAKRKGYMGWNIAICEDVESKDIEFVRGSLGYKHK